MARNKEKHWSDGKPVSKHRAGIVSLFDSFTWLFFLLAAITGGIAVMAAVIETNESPMVPRLTIVICGLLTAGLIVWPIVRYVMMVKSVDLFEEGVVWSGTEEATWEEITAFYRFEQYVNGELAFREARIETEDGRQAVFNIGLSFWEKLADRIQEETFARQWPQAREQFEAGKEVEFGDKVAVSEEGITFKGELLPWKRVKRVQVSNGHLCVHEKGKEDFDAVPLGDIPNYGVLLRLLDLTPARR
jgi:hypothetical protein